MTPISIFSRLARRPGLERIPRVQLRTLASSISAKQHGTTRSGRRKNQLDNEWDKPSTRSRATSKKTQPRHKRPVEPRNLVLPDIGLTARQLAALADASQESVLKCARELDESLRRDTALLSPALIELVTEELRLNVRFRAQTDSLLKKSSSADENEFPPRMPVLTVMGHVDHGKTSLLDALRNTDVAGKEFGGITQSVAAFQVPIRTETQHTSDLEGFATFIDTPGHAAFKAMRANGTVATDIVILVVAADDGVMPQSVEAANLARAADVPIIVAINKCDAPGADPDHVRYQLVDALGINTEQLGGDVQCVDVSAKTGQNLPNLLEAVALQTEMLNLRSNPAAPAAGICLESRVDRSLGSVATVVVRDGTLFPGDFIIFQSPKAFRGDLYGKVRGLVGKDSEQVKEARPGFAVGVVGVRETIPPGAEFCVVPNEKTAKARSHEMILRNTEAMGTIELANSICSQRDAKELQAKAASEADATGKEPLQASKEEESENDIVERNIIVIIKGDVKGSADAVKQCVEGLGTPEYPIRVVHVGVGDVTDNDVKMVSATRGAKNNKDFPMLVAFNVRMKDAEVRNARQAGVHVLQHNIIYHLEDEIKEKLEVIHNENKMIEDSMGKAAVVRVFEDGRIAGCSVEDGKLTEGDTAKVWRYPDMKSGSTTREVVFTGTIESIKQFAKTVRSVKKGTECGIGLIEWSGFISGDVIECITLRRQGEGPSK